MKEWVAREFARLSSQEVLFHSQAQSISHEMLASGRPDHFKAYYVILGSKEKSSEAKDKAMEELLIKVSEVWLRTNGSLFKHVLDYEVKLDVLLDKAGGWIRAQEESIWMTMFQITGDIGATLCASLNIVLHLLETLPSFPANLMYQSNSPIICRLAPKAYAQPWLGLHSLDFAHALPPDSCRKAKDILKEAILHSTGGSVAATGRTDLSASTPTAPTQFERDAKALHWEGLPSTSSSAVCSPSKRRCTKSPSPHHLWSGSSSSGESSASEHRSRGSHSSSLSSSGSGSGSGSGGGSHDGSPDGSKASASEGSVHSQTASDGSVEVLSGDEASGGEDDVLDSANEADVSQGSMSLLDISTTDDEDTRKHKACELAHKSDTDFAAWKDKLIWEGMMGIQEWASMVNDYADGGKRKPKNPDDLGPPVSYMKEHGVFQPLPSTTNPLGLCCFYPMDPVSMSMLAPPKSPTMAEHLKGLLLLAKMQCQPYIIVVFQDGPMTPLGLLQELHMWNALARIPIFWSDETKDRHRPCVSCCPFCAYTIQNNPAYLNHIVGMHYHANFACGACLSAVTASGQQMKRHLNECSGAGPSSQDNVSGKYVW